MTRTPPEDVVGNVGSKRPRALRVATRSRLAKQTQDVARSGKSAGGALHEPAHEDRSVAGQGRAVDFRMARRCVPNPSGAWVTREDERLRINDRGLLHRRNRPQRARY
jgi:hypothetical protein